MLAIWAADCAEHVLCEFERFYTDDRPRKAIQAARDWACGKIKIIEARKFSFASHAAARDAKSPEAIAAARAAGHAAATAHVATHAKHAAQYALKATTNAILEREWQLQQIPDNCRFILD